MAGRRRVSSFNPLGGDKVGNQTNDVWVCTSTDKVSYYARANANSKIQKYVEPGDKIRAAKQGEWLSVLDAGPNHLESGLYLPVNDPSNQAMRLFKNERAMLWEQERTRTRSGSFDNVSDGFSRNVSSDSFAGVTTTDGSKMWICTAEQGVLYRNGPSHSAEPGKRCELNEQVSAIAEDGWLKVMAAGKETGSFLPMTDLNTNTMLFHAATNASKLRAGSFRWVDSEGMSHRMSQTNSEEVKESEVWICIAPTSIAYCNDPECISTSSTYCKPGEKVNGVKEGSSIRVMQVSSTTDVADFIGRRSLRDSTQIHTSATGMYLPFNNAQTGDRYFKNEKLVLWEQAQRGDLPEKEEGGSCSVM